MIRNYITIAFRNLFKHKAFSILNLIGLAVGIGTSLLILQYASFELSYDQFHEHANNTYRLSLDIYKNQSLEAQNARVSPAVASSFQKEFPGIDKYTRLVILGPDGVLTYNDRYAHESNIVLADSAFLDVFSFNLLRGDKRTAFSEPFCIVITESIAQSIFDGFDPIGKEVIVNAKNFDGTSFPFKVTGVIEDMPANTHLTAGVLISYPTLFEFVGHRFDESWSWNETYTYVRLHPDVNPKNLETQFPQVVHRFNQQLARQQLDWVYKLQPITDIHLHSDLQYELAANGEGSYVYLLIIVGVVVMLLAYINYINLVTVKAMQRAKEIGIRKVSGAFRRQLINQFFFESLLLNGLALVVAVALADLARQVTGEIFDITFSSYLHIHPGIWFAFLILFLLLVIGSAFYPAFILSAHKPIHALKGSIASGYSGNMTRKFLVTGQFAMAIILIALTFAARTQVQYMQRQSLGFNPEQIVVIKSPKAFDYGYGSNFEGFRNSVNMIAHVNNTSAANVVPGQEIHWYDDQVTLDGNETPGIFSMLAVAPNYFTHYNIPLVAGRLFGEQDQDKWIVNEAAIYLLGFEMPEQALGKKLNGREIIGIVKDFHHESLKTAIPPILFSAGEVFNYYSVKLETKDIAKTLAEIKTAYSNLFPGSPYEYFFLDEFFDRQYKAESIFNNLFGLFSALAIFVACLGLFGLSSYITSRRSKEIGIRKVMGATITSVVVLLNKDFVQLILVAGVLATPMAYLLIDGWLESYAFRIGISWWLLTAPAVIILLLALITVSVQTIRTALINPSRCLRYE